MGQEFELVTLRLNWGEERVDYYDQRQRLKSMPARWTSALEGDPVVRISAGRSHFRVADLLELSRLIEGLQEEERPPGKASDEQDL